MILYRHLTYTDWYAIHARGRKTGGGDRHIALDKIVPDSYTSQFLGATTHPRKLRVTAIGTKKTQEIEFKDWGGNRNQWTVIDQATHRHPAIDETNGFPKFDDPNLWAAGSSYDSKSWLAKVIVYWVRCPGPDFYMGYHIIGTFSTVSWPPKVQVMLAPKPKIGLIKA